MSSTSPEASDAAPAADPALEREVARLIVDTLHLETEPEAISPLDPLFRDGLGLDSIDRPCRVADLRHAP